LSPGFTYKSFGWRGETMVLLLNSTGSSANAVTDYS
jgi:hypothetical protein